MLKNRTIKGQILQIKLHHSKQHDDCLEIFYVKLIQTKKLIQSLKLLNHPSIKYSDSGKLLNAI